MAPFDGKYLTSYLMAIVMFALSITIKFARNLQNKKNATTFTLKVKVKVKEYKKWELCHLSGNVQTHIGEFCHNFTYLATYIYVKSNTQTHACTHVHTHSARDRPPTD